MVGSYWIPTRTMEYQSNRRFGFLSGFDVGTLSIDIGGT
jgi:hypothetical protein